MLTVKCPSCTRQLEVEDAYRDWTVRCPHCGHEFVPDDAWDAERRSDERPRRRRRDEYDDRDERDDRYGEPDTSSEVHEEARRIVAAPGLWLELCGWMSVLCAIGVTALCMVFANEIANNPQANQNGDPAEMFIFIGCCVGILGAPYGIAMAIGGRCLRNLTSRGWAMTGAILGVASFTMFGILGLVQTGIGVWALVTLDKPEVREAFGLPPRPSDRDRRRRRPRREWED
jgi:hypothetical protein